MTRISTLLSPLLFIGVFRLAFGSIIPAGFFDAARQPGYADPVNVEVFSLRGKLVSWVLGAYGVGDLTEVQMASLTVCVVLYCAAFGYLAHSLLKHRGFGPSLNGIVGFAGACCGLVALARAGMRYNPDQLAPVVLAVVMSSFGLLALGALCKRLVVDRADSFLSGARAARAPAGKERGAAADRFDAIAARN